MSDDINIPLDDLRHIVVGEGVEAAVLKAKKRKSLPTSSFALPSQRKYPIHDRAHAANALARSAGKPEASTVKAAVCKRYPDLPACKKTSS